MTELKNKVVVMDFTGVYRHEPFARQPGCHWLDCHNINGTDCYCDHEAADTLRHLISAYPLHGIHFIDSGNYHYITKFWTERIHHPFSLIVFDHHPDMQSPRFSGLLSCGSWVKALADSHPYLRKIVIIGASDNLIASVPESYKDKVVFYSETSLEHESTWKRFARRVLNEPVYISIDKDVLRPSDAATNWNQGSLSLTELKKLLTLILQKEKIIGIDICGESSPTSDVIQEENDARINNRTNESLLQFFLHTPSQQTA